MMYERLEPYTRDWLKGVHSVQGPSLIEQPVEKARKMMVEGQGATLTDPKLMISRHHAPTLDFYIVRPTVADHALPIVVFLHGGGWVLGDFETHKRLVQEIAIRSECAVVFPEYPLAPEFPFPEGLEACYDFIEWLPTHGVALNLDTKRMALAGDSSGGNLAAVLAVLAYSRGGPSIQLQILLYPVTDCDFSRSSYQQFGKGYYLDAILMEWFWKNYIPDPSQRKNPLACPMLFPLSAIKGIAPALIVLAECDVLSDEVEAYANHLLQAGVSVEIWKAQGTVHSFLLDNALAGSIPTQEALQVVCTKLSEVLRPGAGSWSPPLVLHHLRSQLGRDNATQNA